MQSAAHLFTEKRCNASCAAEAEASYAISDEGIVDYKD